MKTENHVRRGLDRESENKYMVILIAGATHVGKTAAAQALLERFKYPYMSLDHLKMALIKSGLTSLTPGDDEELTPYLWGIAAPLIETVIENGQNLIVEGCYIPFDWKRYFKESCLRHIKYRCLIMSEDYINCNYDKICGYECVIEKRLYGDAPTKQCLIKENAENLRLCKKFGLDYVLIDKEYRVDLNL